MNLPPPSFYDDLDESRSEALRLIARGVQDRRSPFHHPTIATIARSSGHPRIRTAILRGFEANPPALRFHTDRRSSKVVEIRSQPQIAVHFYDPAAKIQLRLEGWAKVHTDDPVADAAWAASPATSRQCYGIAPGPGTAIDLGGAFTLPVSTDEATAPGRANFCAVVVDIANMEWLYLAGRGHRRAFFDWSSDGWSGQWLAP